ncbi:threonine/serine dehydratase [Pigmentiphaga sp. H8]|uniref:threonine ammonia-lyase n=1 Tax=unclassified Pigmentiphaga TaxID=2626614 RepID=UPI000F59E140|nr:threonine/serine dehydratase [Pigmentiphaga sp. H8]AZG10747.1 threonine/serine dehydratase [Pigmentiphaga sp. H8]
MFVDTPLKSAADVDAVFRAAERIRDHVVTTPLLRSGELDAHSGGRIFLKAENLQRSGSFKFRGACNRMLAMSAAERARGVVAYSSGNHALAVSEAGRLLGVPAVVIMPADAPAIKIEGCRQRGATVLLYDREHDDREAIGRQLVETQGLTLVPPFDDALVMAGAGTGALEALGQIPDVPIDTVLVCCSGGGLAAGWSLAVRASCPRARIVVVEPEGFDDTGRSLQARQPLSNQRRTGSVLDALLAPAPGRLTLPVLLAQDASGVTVSDADALAAMYFAFSTLKLVLEPGGAAALAAVLARKTPLEGRNALVVCSGGNVDPQLFARCLESGISKGEGPP